MNMIGKPLYSIYLLLQLFLTVNSFGQNLEKRRELAEKYKLRAQQNLEILAKDTSIVNHVEINSDGVYLYATGKITEKRTPEIVLYWEEVHHFLEKVYSLDYYESVEWYNTKGSHYIAIDNDDIKKDVEIHESFPTDLSDIKVAIDPGHFAGNFQEALFEEKYLKVRKESFVSKNDKLLFEAELNYSCSMLLKYKLDSAGATTFITRDQGSSAVGKDFNEWYSEDFVYDVQHLVAQGDFSSAFGNWLITEATRKEVFNNCYKYIDFTQRSRNINYFKPDITLIIHFNASENNPRDKNNFTSLVSHNYSMAFVPGAFMRGELKKQDARIDFLRLLLSKDLEASIKVGKIFLTSVKRELGVSPIPNQSSLGHMERACNSTGIQGLYARNLVLTRQIKSPLLYAETLYQDNETEFKALIRRDYKQKNVFTSRRVAEVAEVYFNLIGDWVESNKANTSLIK